jgi:hypothetical protein
VAEQRVPASLMYNYDSSKASETVGTKSHKRWTHFQCFYLAKSNERKIYDGKHKATSVLK